MWSVLLEASEGSQGFEEYRTYLTEQFMSRAKRVFFISDQDDYKLDTETYTIFFIKTKCWLSVSENKLSSIASVGVTTEK